jgi:uncharacterized protein (DUF1330 family)
LPAYVIANVDITDPDGYAEVKNRVRETIERHGGRYLSLRGKMEVAEGDWVPRQVAIIEFPSYEDARRWYDSAEYEPLKEIRMRTARSEVILIDGVESPPSA